MEDTELREQILIEFKQVHKLAPADYTENCTNVVMSMVKAHYEAKIVDARIDGIDKAYRLLKPHMDRSFSTDDLIVTRTAIAHLKKEKH